MGYSEFDKRMKKYEYVTRTHLTTRTPVIIRIDGKTFHTFTRGFRKPFDEVLSEAMQKTMKYLCENVQGCVFGYTQSDEITLVLVDYQKINTSAWFDYNVQKCASIAASMATMRFNQVFTELAREYQDSIDYREDGADEAEEYWLTIDGACRRGAMFDARVFNIPKEEVTNNIYWRQQDATRNSIQMVGRAYFSDRQMHGKNTKQVQEMLFSEKGINWNDTPTKYKRGSCCIRVRDVATGRSSWIIDEEMPILKGDNRSYVDDLIKVGE